MALFTVSMAVMIVPAKDCFQGNGSGSQAQTQDKTAQHEGPQASGMCTEFFGIVTPDFIAEISKAHNLIIFSLRFQITLTATKDP